ncbi:S-type pyocin domain-containing protein [Pectobacterium carotovorum]
MPKAVRVLMAERDKATGLDRIRVPSVAGEPERTILINPVAPPAKSSSTGNDEPAPVTPKHTGTDITPVESITVTTTPVDDHKGLQDFIYWSPDAAGTGVEPVYVVISDPYGETNPSSGNKLDIRLLPDANGKNHSTAVKGDAKIPVDKIELYMRGKASGDLEALQKEYNSLKDAKISSQKEFAKDPSNAVRLKQLSDQIHNIERSRDMDRVLNNAGIPNTPTNNSMIMDKLLDSATSVTPANRQTSVVVTGNSGSVRVYATWTILPDGSKRLSTVQTGAFK